MGTGAVEQIRARWAAVPAAPWRWDDQPDGVIRVWFGDAFTGGSAEGIVTPPDGYEPTIACVIFPGDMETYEGPDLRLAEALAAAPADIAALLAEVAALRRTLAEQHAANAALTIANTRLEAELARLKAIIDRTIEDEAREDYAALCGPTSARPGPAWAALTDARRAYFRAAVAADFWRDDPARGAATGAGEEEGR